MIENWDYLIRLISVGSALMLIAMVVASEVRLNVRVPLIGMLVGVTGYMLNHGPLMATKGVMAPWIDFLFLSTPFWIWLFGRRLFEREPPQSMMLGAAAAMMLGWFLSHFVPFTRIAGFLILHVVALGLVIDLVRIGIFEREDDLVEDRRIVRLWLPLLLAVQAAQILIVQMLELVFAINSKHPGLSLLNTVIILVMMLFAGLALFRTNRDLLPGQDTPENAEPEPELVAELDLNPSEKVLHDKLIAAMDEGAYTAPGLTITALAEQLGTPEHRLRALINQRLGHRNFSAFLNRFRIAEAQALLSSTAHVDLPILTIAMDLGYNSLPPFNRAFRQETGKSPSEFRKLAFVEDPIAPPSAQTNIAPEAKSGPEGKIANDQN